MSSGVYELRDLSSTPQRLENGTSNPAYTPDPEDIDELATAVVHVPGSGADVKDDDSDPSDNEDANCCSKSVSQATGSMSSSYKRHETEVKYTIVWVLLMLWVAYFIWAMIYHFEDGYDSTNEPAIRLIGINAIAAICVTYWIIKKYYGAKIWKGCLKPCVKEISAFTNKYWHILQWVLAVCLLAGLTLILVFDVAKHEKRNLISLIGMATYISLFYVFSAHPSKVVWRPVIIGLLLQFIFAYLILRTCPGYLTFKWLGDRIQEFLNHTNAGAKFVFGERYGDHPFAFKILPIVIFFSTVISMLYYLGVMQAVIVKVAWVMQVCMGTTAGESLNAAGNIFVGQTEAPLMIKPMLADMTKSELHAVMTGGFATIAGSVLATYISFGVPANHLLSASVMSAPAALAMSKLFYPETKKSRTTVKDAQAMGKPTERNLIEAASAGASSSIKLVANIGANLIAFMALLQFVNETLKWLGANVGRKPPDHPDFTFQFICSYVLWPFAWVMGTPAIDCKHVATLLGVKTFINEFVAYEDLAKLRKNRELIAGWENAVLNQTVTFNDVHNCYTLGNSTYTAKDCLSQITERGETIAIYALCGFANLASMGIMVGGLGAMVPERKKDITSTVLRAMIAGNVACFMTACIAGLLTIPGSLNTETCGSL